MTASDGSLAISSNKFTVAGDTGNTVVSGHLAVGGPTGDSAKEVYVTGDIEATGTLAIGGDATFAGAVTVTGLFTALGDYRIGDSAPSDSLTVNAASNYTGTTTMSNTLDVIGAATLESTLRECWRGDNAVEHAGSSIGRQDRRSGEPVSWWCQDRMGPWQSRQTSSRWLATRATRWWRGRWTPGLELGSWTVEHVEQPELGSCDAVEHAGCDGSDDAVEHVERDGSGDAVELSSTLDVAGDVDVNSGKFAVTA